MSFTTFNIIVCSIFFFFFDSQHYFVLLSSMAITNNLPSFYYNDFHTKKRILVEEFLDALSYFYDTQFLISCLMCWLLLTMCFFNTLVGRLSILIRVMWQPIPMLFLVQKSNHPNVSYLTVVILSLLLCAQFSFISIESIKL